jgi:hypothetical protein
LYLYYYYYYFYYYYYYYYHHQGLSTHNAVRIIFWSQATPSIIRPVPIQTRPSVRPAGTPQLPLDGFS